MYNSNKNTLKKRNYTNTNYLYTKVYVYKKCIHMKEYR